MRPSFNLVDQPWIPCLVEPGKTREFGLAEVLIRAHELKEIVHESPLVVASFYRLLLAALHRVFGPEDMMAWVKLWNQGSWEAEAIREYFKKWRHRFDLFDRERPFFQTADVSKKTKNGLIKVDPSPVQRLAQQLSGGNNKVLFDHTIDQQAMFWSPAVCARYLLAAQYFALGGGVSYPFNLCDGSATKGYNVFALGDNLFQTLSLNLVVYRPNSPMPSTEADKPYWESEDEPIPHKNGTAPKGYLDYLTWQSRQILLIPTEEEKINECRYQQNLRLPEGFDRDPFKAYVVDNRGIRPNPLSIERVVWRDSAALFQPTDRKDFKSPIIFNHLADIEARRQRNEIHAKSKYRFQVIGIASEGKAANIVIWRRDVFPLPLAFLTDQGLLGLLENALNAAEKTAVILDQRAYRLASRFLYPGSDAKEWKPNKNQKKDIDQFKNSLRPTRDYWSKLENPFRRLLVDLAEAWEVRDKDDEANLDQVKATWAKTLRQAAINSFEVMIGPFQGTGRGLKAIAQAERGLLESFYHTSIEYGLIEEKEDEHDNVTP